MRGIRIEIRLIESHLYLIFKKPWSEDIDRTVWFGTESRPRMRRKMTSRAYNDVRHLDETVCDDIRCAQGGKHNAEPEEALQEEHPKY